MKWFQLPLGPLQTNCYIVYNQEKKCLIIDPGEEAEKLIKFIKEKGVKPQAVLITHAHFDHIGALDDIREEFDIPAYIHEKEANWLLDPALNGSQLFMAGKMVRMKPADHILTNEGKMTVGDFSFHVYETPGHSPGSVSFYFENEGFVVAGDALFNGSIGRTDLPFGNHEQLLKSIHDKLLTLPEETIVLPGHGPETEIGREMDSNPYLHGF
jgi:hydroxyacylglutathione hydrolase